MGAELGKNELTAKLVHPQWSRNALQAQRRHADYKKPCQGLVAQPHRGAHPLPRFVLISFLDLDSGAFCYFLQICCIWIFSLCVVGGAAATTSPAITECYVTGNNVIFQ